MKPFACRAAEQLRHPQASQHPSLAGPSSALDFPLHPDVKLLAERGRGLFRQTHPQALETWRVQIPRRPEASHRPLYRRAQQNRSQAIRLESRPRQNHRRKKSRVPSVGFNPLGVPQIEQWQLRPALQTLVHSAANGSNEPLVTNAAKWSNVCFARNVRVDKNRMQNYRKPHPPALS